MTAGMSFRQITYEMHKRSTDWLEAGPKAPPGKVRPKDVKSRRTYALRSLGS